MADRRPPGTGLSAPVPQLTAYDLCPRKAGVTLAVNTPHPSSSSRETNPRDLHSVGEEFIGEERSRRFGLIDRLLVLSNSTACSMSSASTQPMGFSSSGTIASIVALPCASMTSTDGPTCQTLAWRRIPRGCTGHDVAPRVWTLDPRFDGILVRLKPLRPRGSSVSTQSRFTHVLTSGVVKASQERVGASMQHVHFVQTAARGTEPARPVAGKPVVMEIHLR